MLKRVLCSTFLITILLAISCNSGRRTLNELFESIADKPEISATDWDMLIRKLEKNRTSFQKHADFLFDGASVDQQAVIDRVIIVSGSIGQSPAFSRNLTTHFIDEKIRSLILDGSNFRQAQDETEGFISSNRSLIYASYPELYDDPEYKVAVLNDIYNAHIISPRLYLERSGSMVFYDSGNRNFVNSMRRIINRFPQFSMDQRLVYVVADIITHWDIPYSEFLHVYNVFAATWGMVDPSWTDFPGIFRDILNNTADNQVAVLFSDLIYDVETVMPNISKKALADQGGEMTHAVFRTHGSEFGMIIIKMEGDYDGLYFPPMSGSFQFQGSRPYYICMIGKTSTLHRLMTEEPYRAVREFHTLPGYKASHAFYRIEQSPWYSILTPFPGYNSRHVRPTRASLNKGMIHELENASIHEREGHFRFVVAADLSALWFDENFKTDLSNFRIIASDDFVIEKIIPVSSADLSTPAQRLAKTATHLIYLKSGQLNHPKQNISIEIVNNFPKWIRSTSTLNDTDPHQPEFENTTFGLEQLIKGIHRAFYQAEGNKIMSFELELK